MRTFAFVVMLGLITPVLGEDSPWKRHVIDNTSDGADGVRLADINGNGRLDIVTGWEEGGLTRLYLHPGSKQVREPWPSVTLGKTPSVEDAVFADLLGDGSLCVVSSCEGKTRSLFIHWPGKDVHDWKQEVLPASKDMMMWMYATPARIARTRGVDLVAGGKGPGAAVGWWQVPDDARDLNAWRWHEITPAGWIMSIIVEDMNGNGLPDVVISDRKGPRRACRWLENPGPGPDQFKPWKSHIIGAAGQEVMFMTLADVDGDGLQDAVAVVKPAKVMIFRRLDKTGTRWASETVPYPKNTGTAKGIAVGDLDGDGIPDLVLSCEHATPPKSGVVWMKRQGDQWIGRDIAGPTGIKFDLIKLVDLGGDGDLDVLTCEESHQGRGLGVIWYENPHR